MKRSIWRVLVPVCAGTGLSLLGDSALYAVLPTAYDDTGVVLASVGVLLSINRWVRLVTNSGAGWLVDHRPRRQLFVPALFLGVVSTAMYAFAPGFGLFLVARLLWGAAWSGIWVAGNAIVLDVTNGQDRGRAVGWYHMSFFMGAGLGSPLGGILTDFVGYRPTMWILAGLMLIGALVAAFFLPETKGMEKREEIDEIQEIDKNADQRPRVSGEMVSAVGLQGVNRLLVAGILLSTFGLYLTEQFGEVFVIGRWELGVATVTGLGLGLSAVLSVIAAPLMGNLSDRWGNRWAVAAIGLACGMIGFGLLVVGLPWLVVLGLPLISFSSGSNQGLATTIAGDLVRGQQRGRFLGLFYTLGDVASAVGPPLAYWVIAQGWASTVNYQLAAVVAAGMLLVTVYWGVRGRVHSDVLIG